MKDKIVNPLVLPSQSLGGKGGRPLAPGAISQIRYLTEPYNTINHKRT